MLFIFGLKTVTHALPGRTATCQRCGQFIMHYIQERKRKFTLFFIPVFTTSKKYESSCSNCGWVSTLSARQHHALGR